MKYKVLTQIPEFLSKFKKITNIKRVDDCALEIVFDGNYPLVFDLNKSNSSIYKTDEKIAVKEYKAPFDITLKKRLNSAKIDFVEALKNNRILKIKTTLNGSYKAISSILYLEFTGRFTNIILTDENDIILEALRHMENEKRTIKVGKKLTILEPFDIKESECEQITDFDEYFKMEFLRLKTKKLDEIKQVKLLNLDKKITNLNANLSELPSKEELETQSHKLNKNANLIIANLYLLNDYERELKLADENGAIINLKLENSPKNSANEMFKESKKLKQKAANISLQVLNLKEKIEFLNKLKNIISLSKSTSEISILSPKKSQTKSNAKLSDLIENFYVGEFKISVGKSEKGNEFLLKNAKKDDFWFHLKDRPSTHVVVKTNKRTLSEDIINFAAKLCVSFSTTQSGNYLIDYTKKQNVKVVNGAFVNYVNYKTIGIQI
ncbi:MULTISPECIES: NFACT RNA binding domain-containing protein [Campylobacter]|uniref:NFACT RNA binding domain-containing protein n=1 Tax=Campylobacter TaxID=194 RepID=UPI00138E3C16|nr:MULTISPECIES: NFACT RNA binding domain-containing protein [Campylobacter]MDV2490541.1 NFACT RNA binding domain-containing protein [Campylobacter sp. TJR-1]